MIEYIVFTYNSSTYFIMYFDMMINIHAAIWNNSKESDDNNDYQLVISNNDSNDHMTSNDNEHNFCRLETFIQNP